MLKFLAELDNIQQTLKKSGSSDAGAGDIENKGAAQSDVSFANMRNAINANANNITGSFVANFINKAEELNDEIDTIVFGAETDDGHIIKIYVDAEQAEEFEQALKTSLGLDTDIETVLNDLAATFDIVDIVWPTDNSDTVPEEDRTAGADADTPSDTNDLDSEIDAALQSDGETEDVDDDAFTDTDDFEVVSALPPTADNSNIDDVDDANPTNTDSELNADDIPVPDDNGEDSTPWMELNDLAIKTFDGKEITGAEQLTYDQLAKLIDIDAADEIAINQYDAADFEALKADEKEDIINANPDLIKDTGEDEDNDTEAEADTEESDDTEDTEDEDSGNKKNTDSPPVKESLKFSLLSRLL